MEGVYAIHCSIYKERLDLPKGFFITNKVQDKDIIYFILANSYS